MRIGVDLDGVLNDVAEWHFACGSKFCLEQNINRGFNPKGYYMEDQFHLSSEENTVLPSGFLGSSVNAAITKIKLGKKTTLCVHLLTLYLLGIS